MLNKIKAFLLELNNREHYDEGLQMSVFKDNPFIYDLDVVKCTCSAMLIAHKFKGKVYGYAIPEIEKNGEMVTDKKYKNVIAFNCLGHDFAVVGNFLIDWWAENVEETGKSIYDLTNEKDLAIVNKKYLPRHLWEEVEMWELQKISRKRKNTRFSKPVV